MRPVWITGSFSAPVPGRLAAVFPDFPVTGVSDFLSVLPPEPVSAVEVPVLASELPVPALLPVSDMEAPVLVPELFPVSLVLSPLFPSDTFFQPA